MNLHHGVGINDADYNVYSRGYGKQLICPFYSKWAAMIARCYSGKDERYEGCSVSKEWHRFLSFKSWMESQDWEGKQLDKDLLVIGNKEYSAENCCFLPTEWNSTFQRRRKKVNNDRPTGTGIHPSGLFKASISIDGKGVHLGYSKTILGAHLLWQEAMLNKILSFASTQEGRIKEALLDRASTLHHQINFGLETKQL